MSDTFILGIGLTVFVLLSIGLYLTYSTFKKVPEMERKLREGRKREIAETDRS